MNKFLGENISNKDNIDKFFTGSVPCVVPLFLTFMVFFCLREKEKKNYKGIMTDDTNLKMERKQMTWK